jgi:hypothetical protein
MNGYSHSDPDFRKKIKRDALIHVGIFFILFIFVFLIPFVAYLGQKYNW